MPDDVTAEFQEILGELPVPPLNSLISGDEVMAGAEDRSYLGRPVDSEEKHFVTRPVLIPYETDIVLSKIAVDDRFDYESKSDVIRHAVQMYVTYLVEHATEINTKRGLASDIVTQQNAIREAAHRARVRQQMREDIGDLDKELEKAIALGDYVHIAREMERWTALLRTCDTETERVAVRDIIAGSVVIRAAEIAFYKWTHDPNRAPVEEWQDDWIELSEVWNQWYIDQELAYG